MKQSSLRLLTFALVLVFLLLGARVRFSDAQTARKKPQTRGAYRAELDALIKSNTVPCKAKDDCTALPLGVKACGGPLEYIILSTGTQAKIQSEITDLTKTINEMDNAENVGKVGTCDAVAKPEVACQSGSCVRGTAKN